MKVSTLGIILSLVFLSFGSASAFFSDMGIYQQNYKVVGDNSVLVLESGTDYKLKFKGIGKNVDESTLANIDLPKGVVEIRHDEHKTMGSSTIHVVRVAKTAPAFTGYIHLVTYDGDGGDRVKSQDYFIRTIVVSGSNHSSRKKPVCGEVTFGKNDRYMIEFKNIEQLNGAKAKLVNEGRCK